MKLVLKTLALSLIITIALLLAMYIAATQFVYTSFIQALLALVLPPVVIVFIALYGLTKD